MHIYIYMHAWIYSMVLPCLLIVICMVPDRYVFARLLGIEEKKRTCVIRNVPCKA
jgi:hypothetical protein